MHSPKRNFKRDLPSYTLAEAINLPPPSWLVEDTLPDGGLSFLVGPPGVGKTFSAIDLALSVAYGRPFLGKEVRQGRVVYVAAEGHRSVARRMLAWCRFYGLDEELTKDLIIIPDAIDLLGGDASADEFFEAVGEKFPVNTKVTVDNEGQEQHEPIDAAPIRLVIFDTLARCVIGADENSAEDMGQAVAFFDHLRKSSNLSEASDTHVMAIHHTNKLGTLERGSTVLRGAADTVVFLQHSGVGTGQVFSISKQRDAEEGEPIPLRLETVDELESAVLIAETGVDRPNSRVRGGLTRREREVLTYHLNHHQPGIGCSNKQIGEGINMSTPNVVPVRRSLADRGYIIRLGNGQTQILEKGVAALLKDERVDRLELRGDAADIVRQVEDAMED